MISTLVVFLCLLSCGQEKENTPDKMADPTDLRVEQLSETSVRLTWQDHADGEEGYYIYLRKEGQGYYVDPLTTLPADAGAYTFEGLETGSAYYFGVQALGPSMQFHSGFIFTPKYTMLTALEASRVENPDRLPAPSPVAEQTTNRSVRVAWTAVPSATGYAVYQRKEGTDADFKAVETLSATATEHTFAGLSSGGRYTFAVQTLGTGFSTHSALGETSEVVLYDLAKFPTVNAVEATYAYVKVNYTVNADDDYAEHGLCFSATGVPTVADIKRPGPSLTGGRTVVQVVPNAALQAGTTYRMRVYSKEGDLYYYSAEQEVRLSDEPAQPQLVWKKLDNPEGIPAGVAVYETTSLLSGRNFHAWYAIADCTGDIELRVLAPTTAKRVDQLAAQNKDECYVLVNGGFFTFNGSWKSPYVVDGQRTGEGYGSDKGPDGAWTLVTPGVFGVDRNGKPAAWWWAARKDAAYCFSQPLPTTPGEAKYWYEGAGVVENFPEPSHTWVPYNAISAGPMVLYDGKVVVDDTRNGSSYVTNYELLASDIFPGTVGNMPDRTCIGCTADGKVVLFICDGRVDESRGATLPELGLIMKSLGCVSAMNLDGGGSTGMMLGQTHLNTWLQGLGASPATEYRPVYTAVGFFRKRY